VARLKLGMFGTPEDELAQTVDGDVPQWIERLYFSYGPTSEMLLATTRLDEASAQTQLEDAGVWVIARQYAPAGKDGNVRWSRGLIP
jgi:hypothetical protein